MPLPAMVTYNDLDGTEVAQVLRDRMDQFLGTVPHFQKHITLPRVRVTWNAKLELYADQPTPDVISLGDRFEVLVESEHGPTEVFTGESVDCSAPTSDGHPPDEIREMHNLPVTEPVRGPREIGAQLYISDQPVLENREVEGMPGLKINRTGSGMIDGMAIPTNATVAKIDMGPDGMRSHPGMTTRERWHIGSKR